MMETKSHNNGIGFGSVLFLIFLTLKLTGVIAWSWWWVTAPIWAPLVLLVLIWGVVLALAPRR